MDPVVDQPAGEVEPGLRDKPDLMNDPAYDPNLKDQDGNADEADTCRICRGEGSQEEPLFYPCKCSGSIKFVHQNCLMEWLSHSQKKYCELCKTPFHFTKLYSPNMPNTVPLPIFLRQAAMHTWTSMLASSRLLLVFFVWSMWLPWCMRTIWRGLFWIGDGSWANWAERRLFNESMAYGLPSRLAMPGVTPIEQGLLTSKEATASTFVAQISSKLPRFIPPTEKLFSFSSGQPWSLLLLKKIYSSLAGETSAPVLSSASMATNTTGHGGPIPRSSWLSELHFVKTLTPSTLVNNMLIDTLEGQLITLFVVTAFILIFLIREWVVQQQPIINGGINLNAEQAAAPNAAPAPQHADNQRNRVLDAGVAADNADEGVHAPGPRARMIARARPRRPRDLRRHSEQGGAPADNAPTNAAINGAGEMEQPAGSTQSPRSQDESLGSASSNHSSEQPQRPGMPDRDTLAGAAEIRRTIEEHSRSSGTEDFALEAFKDLWNRAGKEPLEFIRIVEQEDRSAEFGWLVAAMKKVEGLDQPAPVTQEKEVSQSSNQDEHNNGGKQPDIDDEFVLLNRSSGNPSPEPALEHNESQEPPASHTHNSVSNSTSPTSSRLSRDESVEPAPEPAAAHSNPDRNEETPPRINIGQDSRGDDSKTLAMGSLPENLDSVDVDNQLVSEHPGRDNPFHPDYEGDIPQPTACPEVESLNEDSAGPSDTNQPNTNPIQLRNGPTQIPPDQVIPAPAKNIIESITDWLWGGVAPLPAPPEQPAGDDEHVVNDIADEAPFVPIDNGQHLPLAQNEGAVANQDPDVVAAAIQAGLNPNEGDAAEEIEDLEGIMELIGMQGPLAGLVQNAMFCACLVSLTILFGVWVPYISGKLFLVLLAHPYSLLFRIPLRWAASSADTIIDVSTFCAACALYWADTAVNLTCAAIGMLIPPFGRFSQNNLVAEIAKSYAESAFERLADSFIATGGAFSETDIPIFSVIAHESLRSMETRLAWIVRGSCDQIATVFRSAYHSPSVFEFSKLVASSLSDHAKSGATLVSKTTSYILSLWPSLLQINPLRINLALPQRTVPLDYGLAYWNTKDRALAIAFGYLFFALLGVAYIHLSLRMNSENKHGRVAGGLADGLYQAGGVMKVILIISIEMIVFPLYCGMLLDVALLPLFNNVTVISRINFTMTSPNTSLFIHWFVGTCYMFHFALFVSMCRKILRTGVLYFIRDPDDPTFHPVRDVLERSVSTQLWKISFSALVYGGLVIVCLGGVVWGITCASDNVFPIRWSSNEPVLEFPVDLLFYNFLMPLAVKFFKPSKGLNKIFSWWFRRCARTLRLTNFLFGDERDDEEGTLVAHKWTNAVGWENEDSGASKVDQNQQAPTPEGLVEPHFQRDGRYVRAPSSDQVRIPRGAHTYVEVDEDNHRLDGQPDSDEGLHGRENGMFTKVYIPPMFRLRISAFIFLIWVFAAATGVSMTILPLVFGRFIFASVAPNHLRMNDIYAFSIGIYTLGGALYGILQRHQMADYVQSVVTPHTTTITSFLRKSAALTTRILSLAYIYTTFGILLPALLSVLMEFYLIIPIHTYFSTTFASLDLIQSERHIIHLIQDWTLGVLYLKMVARVILWNTPSRPATALRAIVRDGWFNPDIRLATRGFIIPAILTMSLALATPLILGWLANVTILRSFSANNEIFKACVYRYSYPGILGLGFIAASIWLLAKAFSGWRKKVRDEVYLIGERLHNFGETKRRKGSGKGKGKAVVGAA